MNKRVKVCLALFLALAVIAQYSFSPQVMIAYGEEGEVTAASEEPSGDSGQTAEKKEAEKPAPAPEQKTTEAPAPAPAASSDSSDTPEPAESAAPAEENDSAEADETSAADDVDVGEEEPAADEEEALEEEEEEEWEKSFTDSCNGLTVHVSAPDGAFKKGTKMVLHSISEATATSIAASALPEDTVVTDAVGVDISFSYKGNTIQPDESVKVSISGANLEGSNPMLYHQHGGTIDQISATNDGASFSTSTFSPFVFAAAEEGESEGETWKVTFYNRDGEVHKVIDVVKGEAIGDQMPPTIPRGEDYVAYWAVGTIDDHGSTIIEQKIDASYVPTGDTTVVPGEDKISHTITFYTDDTKTKVVTSKTVDVDTSYCLNAIPAVPEKSGYAGKWVYGDGKDFSNSVAATADMDVWAEYTQNVFTVTFMVGDSTYDTDTYHAGDALTLPSAPVVEGKQFQGWFIGETQYTGGETVTSDLEIKATFKDDFAVYFVVEHDDGTEERLSQYYRSSGEAIGTLPENPFVAGKVFEKWVDKETGDEVTAATVVKGNMTAVAQFRTVDVYSITAEYYYESTTTSGKEVIFNTDLMQVEAHELPYTITAPPTTQTDPNEVSESPIYYPETPTVTVNEEDFDSDNEYTVRIKYVPYTAEYDFVYVLKDLEGDGYTEIPDTREHVYGVLNSYVTPTVKTIPNCELELAEGATITQAEGQELEVKYTRKNVQLTFETNGGSYVEGVTAPYGSTVDLPSKNPTKDGYTFEGWYSDEALTKKVTGSVTLNGDTTLYAKWTGDTVNYTIVYMFEKYNDAGTESSFVYDNSREGTAQVGTTVVATSAPRLTRAGWEPDTARNNDSKVEIAADGSSVLFVYYKLTEYTFHFRPGTYTTGGWFSNTYNVTASLNGQSRTGNNNYSYSFTAKLGQDISSLWLSASNGTYGNGNRVSFSGWVKVNGDSVYVTKRFTLTEDMLPSSGTTVTYEGYWLTNTVTYTVNYMLQNADNNDYTRSEKYSQTYDYQPGSSLSPKDISGYTFVRRTTPGNNTTNLYYDRDKYKIDYYYGSTHLNTIENVKFDATITSNTYNWTPTAAQCGVDSDYTFAGWYSDSGLTTKYTFNKMPASNLVLYAKWTAPNYTVSFVDGDKPSTHLADNQTVEKYKKAEKPANPTKDGFIFDGWYTTADGDTLYDWNKQITEDTTVYAHWVRDTLSYTVKYVDEDGTPVAPEKVESNPNYTIGQEVTEFAIAVAGYRPDASSKQLTLSGNVSDNVITFIYSAKGETTGYTVYYILDPEEYPGNIQVASPNTVENIPGDTASVIEMAAAVDYTALYAEHSELQGLEFYPDEVEKTLVLTANAENNIYYFYYSSYKSVNVTVNYVDMNGDPIPGISAYTQKLKVGNTFTLNRAQISGWEVNKAVEGTTYAGADAKDSYKITDEVAAEGDLVFTVFYQKKVTITASSHSKQYDGTVLTMPTALADQVTADGLLDGDSLTSVVLDYANADSTNPKGRLNAGVATVTPMKAAIDGAHKASYYKIHYVSGTLEVTSINVTVRIEPDRWTGAEYNGTPYKTGFTNPNKKEPADYIMISHEGYAAEYLDDIWDAITEKDTVIYDASAAGLKYYVIAKTDADDYTYDLGLKVSDLPTDPNYSVSLYVRPGRLQILPVPLKVTTGSATKPYDGTPLTNEEINVEGLVEADEGKVSYEATGSLTDIGSTENSYSIDWGEVNPDNYTITEELGTLTVTDPVEYSISVVVNDKTAIYNGSTQVGNTISSPITGTGSPITTDAYTVTGLEEGHTLSFVYAVANGENAGTYEGSFDSDSIAILDENENDVTSLYTTQTFKPGKLTINQRNVTITTASDSKVYDGTALTNHNYTISGDGFIEGQEPSIVVTGSQTEVGSSKNTFTYSFDGVAGSALDTLFKASAVNEKNYNIHPVLGTLTVTPAPGPTPTPTPTPTPDGDGGGPAAAAAPAAAPTQVVADEPAPTTIDEPAPPKAVNAYWALINLLCAIATALLSLIMLIRYFGKRKEEEEITDPATGELVTRDVDEQRGGLARIASLIPAIGGIIAFILTEDMSLPMAMVDKWTVLMIVILAIQVGVGIVAKLRDDKDDEDEEAMA